MNKFYIHVPEQPETLPRNHFGFKTPGGKRFYHWHIRDHWEGVEFTEGLLTLAQAEQLTTPHLLTLEQAQKLVEEFPVDE